MTTENKTDPAVLLLLGRIDGKVDGINQHLVRQDQAMAQMDERLRNVEQRAAVLGASSGGAMAVGVTLIIEGLKTWYLTRGG